MHKKLLEQAIKETKLQLADASYEPPSRKEAAAEDVSYYKAHIKYMEEQLKTYKARVEDLSHSVKQREMHLK